MSNTFTARHIIDRCVTVATQKRQLCDRCHYSAINNSDFVCIGCLNPPRNCGTRTGKVPRVEDSRRAFTGSGKIPVFPGRVRVPARRDEEGPVTGKGWRARLPAGTEDAGGPHDDAVIRRCRVRSRSKAATRPCPEKAAPGAAEKACR